MADWYVATTGNDTTGNGSSGSPYATLQKAHDSATAGDTVYVEEGVYEQTISGTKNLTIIGVGGMAIFYGGRPVNGSAWSLHAANVWKKTGVTLADGPNVPTVVRAIGTLQPLVFRTLAGKFEKGWQMDNVGELDSATTFGRKFFYDKVADELFVYSTSDPTTAFSSVDFTSEHGTAGAYAGSYGGIYWFDATLTARNIACYGWYGNGMLVDGGSCDFYNCDFSYNSEDGAGGFRCTNPTARYCRMSWNGTQRARAIAEILTDGDGWSWHARLGTETTGILDEHCYFEGNTKDAFQHIDSSTGTSRYAVVKHCNFNVVYNQAGSQTLVGARVTLSSLCLGAVGLFNLGTVNVYGNTFKGAGTASIGAVVSFFGDVTNMRGNIVTGFDLGYVSAGLPGTEDYNCWHTTGAIGLTPAANSITSNPVVYGADLHILRTSPCYLDGVDLSGAGSNFDASGRRRPAVPSMGAMEPSRAGGSGGGSVLLFD